MHRAYYSFREILRHSIVVAVLTTKAFVAHISAAHADPLVTDRPDFTESAVCVAPRRVQVEAGYTFTRSGAAESHTAGELLVRVGLTNRVEIRVGINSFARTDEGSMRIEGIEDSYLGVKLELFDGVTESGLAPTTALIVGLSLPTGASALTADKAEPGAKLCLAWELTESTGLGANINAASVISDQTRVAQFSGSLSVATALSEILGAYAEYFGFAQDRDHGSNTNFFNGGLTVLANEDTQFDGRIGMGLNTASPDYFLGLGVSRRF